MVRSGIIATAIALTVMIAFSVYGYITIPEETMIARHWGLDGQADGWSPRNHVLIGMPLLAVLIAIMFAAIPAIDPRKANVQRSGGLYLSGWIGAVGLLALIHARLIHSAAGGGEMNPGFVLYAVSALIAVIGNFLAKSRSSWFLGVRTPWTLSSEHAWVAANRTTGWLFVLTGVLATAVGLTSGVDRAFPVLFIGVFAAALIGVIVSYFAWRNDPERQDENAGPA